MASLVQLGMYGAINTYDTTTNGLYVIKSLQNNTSIDRQAIYAGELVIKAQCICSMQENTNCYWKQKPLQKIIIFQTCKILHPRLEIIMIRYGQDIPRKMCGRSEAKNKYKDIQLL